MTSKETLLRLQAIEATIHGINCGITSCRSEMETLCENLSYDTKVHMKAPYIKAVLHLKEALHTVEMNIEKIKIKQFN